MKKRSALSARSVQTDNLDRTTDMKRYPTALTIAGSDSCGGAGIQADIKTMSALGCYAASAITAITAQNTLGVEAIEAVSPEVVAAQIRAVMDDIHPVAAKIGMVNDRDTIKAIAATLSKYAMGNLVVDPVMVSTSGSRLMQSDATETFRKELMPMCTLLTPNLPEAEVLSGIYIYNVDDCDKAARIIAQGCGGYVLIKGGHADSGDKKQDRLYDNAGLLVSTFAAKTVDTRNTHGTGCTLSAAITALLARGLSMPEAISGAKDYVSAAIAAGADVNIGQGHGPVNHFFNPCKLIPTYNEQA